MLVISRKRDQTIVIGERIEVTVVEVLSMGVIVEVRAPADVAIEWHTGAGRFRHEWQGDEDSFQMMLHPHGTIHIDRVVQVTLVSIRTEKARLGINAPKSIPVVRKEVQQSRRDQGPGNRGQGPAKHSD